MSQISEKFMGAFRYQCTFSLFLIFRSIIRINIMIGGNKKQRFSILFFFQFAKLQGQRVCKPINNKKGLKLKNAEIVMFKRNFDFFSCTNLFCKLINTHTHTSVPSDYKHQHITIT